MIALFQQPQVTTGCESGTYSIEGILPDRVRVFGISGLNQWYLKCEFLGRFGGSVFVDGPYVSEPGGTNVIVNKTGSIGGDLELKFGRPTLSVSLELVINGSVDRHVTIVDNMDYGDSTKSQNFMGININVKGNLIIVLNGEINKPGWSLTINEPTKNGSTEKEIVFNGPPVFIQNFVDKEGNRTVSLLCSKQ